MPLKINIWRVLGLLAIIAFAVLFFKIVIYLGVSLILFLVGSPLTAWLKKISFRKKQMPDSLASLITLLIMIAVIFGLFFLLIWSGK